MGRAYCVREGNKMNELTGSNVLVTGGLGFIGSHLTRKLVGLGAKVTILDNKFSGGGANPYNISDVKDKVNIQIVDVRDAHRLIDFVKDKDFIFHLAAQTSHEESMKFPCVDVEINVLGTLNLLEAYRKLGSDAVLVFTGSRGQFGRIYKTPVREDALKFPIDVNGTSKQAAESLIKVYSNSYGFNSVCLRLTNTYGPGQPMGNPKQGFLPFFVSQALDDGVIKVFGNGSQLRDFNYVSDVVNALVLCAQNKQAFGEIFNLGSGHPVSVLEIAKTIIEIAGKGKLAFVDYPEYWKKIEIGDYVADISKIKQVLRWEPKVPLKEGLRLMINHHKKYRNRYTLR